MDYDPLRPVIVRFAMCQTRSCANVTILDDFINEPVESFFIFLDEASDVRITLNPVDGEIQIEDDDSKLFSKTTMDFFLWPILELIVVGYELLEYTTSETEGSVELCAVILEPLSGEVPRPFELSATTTDGTAGTKDLCAHACVANGHVKYIDRVS